MIQNMRTSIRLNTIAVASTALLLMGMISGCSSDEKDEATALESQSKVDDSKKDSEDTEEKSEESEETNDKSGTSDEVVEFCSAGAGISMDDLSDPAALMDLYQGMEPPSEIADDWASFMDGMDASLQLSESMKELDPADPNYLEDLNELTGDVLGEEFIGASTRISEWMMDNC